MTRGIYVFDDRVFLDELNLPAADWDALNFVYRSENGRTGLDTDFHGENLLNWMLFDSVTIGKDGRLVEYKKSSSTKKFLSSVGANGKVAIHTPDNDVFAEVDRLAFYKQCVALNVTYARYGKAKEVPTPLILTEMYEASTKSNKIYRWFLLHSRQISIWNRYTDYGTHPTFLSRRINYTKDVVRKECERLGIPFHIAATEQELPCW